jgi:hypothetical protein
MRNEAMTMHLLHQRKAQADIHISSLLVALEYDSRHAQREGDTSQAQWLDQMHAEITKAKAIIDKAVQPQGETV